MWVYATASYGGAKKAASKNINFKREVGFTIKATSKSQKKFKATINGASYFKNVKFVVWSKEKGKDDIRTYKAKKGSGGTLYYNIPVNKHKSEGVYYIETYGTIDGKEEKIISKKKFRVTGPSAENIKITNKNEKDLSFQVTVNGINAPSGIKKTEILVWSKKDKSDLKTYKRRVNSKGTASAAVKLKYHNNNFGRYTIQVKLTDNNNITKTVLTKKYRFDQPKPEVTIKAANKSESKFEITTAKLSYAKNVTYDVWSSVNGKDDVKTYKAKINSDNQWVSRFFIKNHSGTGKHNVRVYAEIKGKKQLAAKASFYVKKDYSNDKYSIMGQSGTTVNQMAAYYKANASYPEFYKNSDAPDLDTFCNIYLEECKIEGIRAEVAFIQSMKETNFLRYGGDVNISQYNFAGLGATGNGVPGLSFPSVRIGARAHIQHLKAYASTESLANPCVDPRFIYVTRGCAPYVEWLGIRENPEGKGWATDIGYGIDIVNRIKKLKTY